MRSEQCGTKQNGETEGDKKGSDKQKADEEGESGWMTDCSLCIPSLGVVLTTRSQRPARLQGC